MRIVTHYEFPPIPDGSEDWSAIDDDTYCGPGSPIGTGPTEAAAIADLLEQLDMHTEQPATYIIRLRQISTGHEADSMLFRGTEAEAFAHALRGINSNPDIEIASIRRRDAR